MPELLSISIPTRNRSKCLADLLQCIVGSIAHGNIDYSLIKIYVFDNASEDDTRNVVNSFKSLLPISYKINEGNIGMGLNIYQAYTATDGNYVWVIGDDELLPPSAISIILKLIENAAPGLIILRELSYRGFLKLPETYRNYVELSRVLQQKNPHYLIAHSLISANVIKKSYFDKKAALKFMDTYYGHMYGIVSGLKSNPSPIILTDEETIRVRPLD